MTTTETGTPPVLETERLILRELNTDDADFITRLVNTPGWLRFIGDRNVRTRDHAIAFLENGPIRSYRELGFGLYMVETKDAARAAGICGVLKRPGLDCPDIGFAFLPEFTGQGFAYESASATLGYAREKLGMTKIAAIVLPENTRSIHLLEKLGLRNSGTHESPAGEKLLLYTTGESV